MQNDKYTERRPDPDAILEKINKVSKGQLTVFLGAMAGVGKTYAMLEKARERQREGIDIVIGWVETHGRAETEKLTEGLAKISPKELIYRDKNLKEMDVDAIIARKPDLVLVDELAHTNITGSRNVRRFQDVEEIIKAGINVYTTLNVQHIESLNDVVAQITGVVIKETVPDYIIEQADNVQLTDIPPEELVKRLKEGKVYAHGQAELALRQFFRLGNITALRELALRFTATSVDKELSEYMREHKIEGPWPAAGRVMVCVSASPFSGQLIRAARRLATGLHAELLAVHIEKARHIRLDSTEYDRLARNMRLAEELGAETITTAGEDLAEELVELARRHNVTSIVIGKPKHSKLWELFHGALVDKLIRLSEGINIYVIQAGKEKGPYGRINTAAVNPPLNLLHFIDSMAMVGGVTVVSLFLKNTVDMVNIPLLYQLPVVLSAFWWGRWPSYFTALCSVLAFDFLFVPPVLTFTVDDIKYVWSFLTFLFVAFVIGGRTDLLRYDVSAAKLREKNTSALFHFSREIAAVVDLDTIIKELAVQASTALNREIVVLLPDDSNRLTIWTENNPQADRRVGPVVNKGPYRESTEAAVASWVYENKQSAGRSSETLPGSQYLYLPLKTRENVVGVLGIKILEKLITPEQRSLMDTWASLAAIAIERVTLSEKARQAELLIESDKLRNALFNSISHEIRTPLSSIIGSASTLLEAEQVYSMEERRELIENIKDGADRMDRILANLLDTARLESGMMKLKHDWCDIGDIVGAALRRLKEKLADRSLLLDIPEDAPLIRGDFVLLEQVVLNLLENAVKYSNKSSPIEIRVTFSEGKMLVTVADRGFGIPEDALPYVFDKFYRAHQRTVNAPGTGLGLAICKGIIEAHNGTINAENRRGGGTKFCFTLPIDLTSTDDLPIESE